MTPRAGRNPAWPWRSPLGTERSRTLAPGQSYDLTLKDGGTAGFRVTSNGVLSDLPDGAEAFVFTDTHRHLALVGAAAEGTQLVAGQILAVVAPTMDPAAGAVAMA